MTVTTAVAADKKEAQPALFTRQSSGLVRELGIPSAIGIALASVVVVNTFINFFAGLAGFARADMIIPLVVGALIWVVAVFAYKYLLGAIPRGGRDQPGSRVPLLLGVECELRGAVPAIHVACPGFSLRQLGNLQCRLTDHEHNVDRDHQRLHPV